MQFDENISFVKRLVVSRKFIFRQTVWPVYWPRVTFYAQAPLEQNILNGEMEYENIGVLYY